MRKSIQSIGLGCALLLSPVLHSSEIIPVVAQESTALTTLGSTVIPYKQVTLNAQIPGRIEHIAGEAGTLMTQGGLLVKIGEDAIRAQHAAAQAQLATAQAAYQNAAAQYNRELQSPASKDISRAPGFGMPAMMDIMMTRPMAEMMGEAGDSDVNRYSDLVNSATQVSQAHAAINQAQAQINQLNASLRDTQALAPFEGMILRKRVEVGDTVQPGQPLVEFAYIKNLRLQADVPSSLVSSLSVGMNVPVKIDSRSDTQARVAQIFPTADPVRHTVTVKFDLPADTIAAPGMYAEVYIPDSKRTLSKEGTLVIPRSALISGRSLPAVLVVTGNTSELRMVRIGADHGNDTVEVVSGLKAGEHIINQPPAGASSGWMPAQASAPAAPVPAAPAPAAPAPAAPAPAPAAPAPAAPIPAAATPAAPQQ